MDKVKDESSLWRRLTRLLPLMTIIAGFGVLLLTNLGIIDFSTYFEQIVIFMLGLLAVDTIVERMQILDQINLNLNRLVAKSSNPILNWETELENSTPLEVYLQGANELFVSGGHLYFLMSRQRGLLQKWLYKNKNAKLMLILEDPHTALSGQTPIWNSDVDQTRRIYSEDIKNSLKIIWSLSREFPKRVEARLTDQVPSLSVMIIDRAKARVCLNLYLGGTANRPIFELSKAQAPKWFELFEERYRIRLWESARIVKSKADLPLNIGGQVESEHVES